MCLMSHGVEQARDLFGSPALAMSSSGLFATPSLLAALMPCAMVMLTSSQSISV